ncbi:T9SS type A sorting domain-containing protein, partial [Pontibacter virosus]
SPSAVGSVKFELSGAQSKTFTDSKAPYALHGDNGRGNYHYGNWNPPATGAYTLKATPYTGSKATGTAGTPLTINFTFTSTSSGLTAGSVRSLHELESRDKEELVVYPNPFSDKATISFMLLENGAYTVSLYDAKGAMVEVLKQGKGVVGDQNTIQVDGTKLSKGLYLVRLQTNGKVSSTKLIVDR